MSNFKSGAGNLDFGSDDDDGDEVGDDDGRDETAAGTSESATEEEVPSSDSARATESTEVTGSRPSEGPEQPTPDRVAGESNDSTSGGGRYPYFVRRSNVGDERDTRLEIHVRDKVADREAAFRSQLAAHLGANEVSKTDAREFALLTAFENPQRVAELMREEGFGALD